MINRFWKSSYMTTHASSGRQWTKTEIDRLIVEDQFRLRGLEVTRLDTFVDAAFAFVLTLLVISFDEIPSNYADMAVAAKRIPAFAASFAMLMVFWLRHRRWSRRYGLENSETILLSVTLILVVLVYVYPLRVIFELLFSSISGGYLATGFEIETYDEARGILVFYSGGVLALSLLFNQLYRATLRGSTSLALNNIELRVTRINMQVWALIASIALLSILLALLVPGAWVSVAGYVYFALFALMPIPSFLDRRRNK
jgi:uncharacterized membrane protein